MGKPRILLALFALCVILEPCYSYGQYRSLRRMFQGLKASMPSEADPGKPLFLTPYLKAGEVEKARELSLVGPLPGANVKSYSGYLTVNETHNSNLFFWFFPAQVQPESAPVLLWLQGGPGGTSMFGLFVEHGPYVVNQNLTLAVRKFPWTSKYSMLYIDNPVGTGFSFTDEKGYARNEDDVGRDLYSALIQFFQIFYEYQKNDFYATGEMLGGYAEFMYQSGLVDEKQKQYVQQQTALGVIYIQKKKWIEAFDVFDSLLNGDRTSYSSFYQNVTGCTNYFNFLQCQEPPDQEYFGKFLSLPEVRKAIHVGNLTFHDGSEVEKHLLEDVMKTIKPWLAVLMDNYRVMLYSGQLDVIVAAPLTERFLPTVPWSKVEEYKQADRTYWKIRSSDTEVAGYVRQVGEFYQVIVRGGGHILPYDQPERSFDMIDRFVSGRGWQHY
ncbi:probable serine carboxypeptidase CPVL isoform X2 [Latimeria chalumnae]|uniref:probable serine carboxypeptidase CPVL isoform X2 n=1 Tax=Latimeria chalumnae TaxID=7897 RepID=UPI0003C17636|nr:PREDICTED: probable serine carboxypeptidase CPVL isoform X2 [Latimeria chalumnae]|eukprot:XP_014342910.1 PREDICTED: probable serine carboxypeptidase CPVL isoform X2 [Latimeria chalumnae]